MTTLNDAYSRPATRASGRPGTAGAPTAEVFGVEWPLYKLHALAAALAAIAVVLIAGGSGVVAMWISAAVMVSVWWGEARWGEARRGGRAAVSARWDDGGRDHHARD